MLRGAVGGQYIEQIDASCVKGLRLHAHFIKTFANYTTLDQLALEACMQEYMHITYQRSLVSIHTHGSS